VDDVDAGALLEHLQREVVGGAVAARACVQLAGIPFGERDEFLQRARRHARMHDHHLRRERDLPHRRQVPARVEGELLVERGIGGEKRGRYE
jgi:hypothetical protein